MKIFALMMKSFDVIDKDYQTTVYKCYKKSDDLAKKIDELEAITKNLGYEKINRTHTSLHTKNKNDEYKIYWMKDVELE